MSVWRSDCVVGTKSVLGAMLEMLIGFVFGGGGEKGRGVESAGVVSGISSVRASTVQSENVVVGGSFRRTVRKVSWKYTACQTLRRCCLSCVGEVGTMKLGSRLRPIAYACRTSIPPKAHASVALLSFMRKYSISIIACIVRSEVLLRNGYSRND